MKIYFFQDNQDLQHLGTSPLLGSKPKKTFSHDWIFFTPHLLTASAKGNFCLCSPYLSIMDCVTSNKSWRFFYLNEHSDTYDRWELKTAHRIDEWGIVSTEQPRQLLWIIISFLNIVCFYPFGTVLFTFVYFYASCRKSCSRAAGRRTPGRRLKMRPRQLRHVGSIARMKVIRTKLVRKDDIRHSGLCLPTSSKALLMDGRTDRQHHWTTYSHSLEIKFVFMTYVVWHLFCPSRKRRTVRTTDWQIHSYRVEAHY